MKDFSKLEKQLGIKFDNQDLLIQAFCHRSYLNENPDFYLNNNERLEFLGDAVLELIVTDYLFNNFPNPEGELTSWRAALVNTQTLAETSDQLNFENFLLLSRGEKNGGKRAREYILANTFESFLGAFYLDQGYSQADKFVKENLLPKLKKILEEGSWQDYKSRFQEAAQREKGITPEYECIDQWGPDHAKHFVIGVFLEKEMIAKGEGGSKQEGEEEAAEKALKVKNWD